MKVLLDTNLFLDVILKRDKYYKNSALIWSLVSNKKIKGYISAISVNNLYYIMKKLGVEKHAEKIIDQILEEFEIIPLTKEILKHARTIKNKDYEDSIQYFSAVSAGCDFIITRNQKDFPDIAATIINPSDFLEIFKIGS